MPSYRTGQTATDHKTGEKVMFNGSDWVSAPQAPGPQGAPPAPPMGAPRKLSPQEQASLKQYRESVTRSDATLQQLNAFDRYNRKVRPTGDFLDRAKHYVSGMMGDSDVNGMDQIASGMARQQRQTGEGATDHWEGLQYLKQVGGTDKSFEQNRQWSARTRASIEKLRARDGFRSQYATQRNTLNGADEAFDAQSKAQASQQHRPGADGYSITPVN